MAAKTDNTVPPNNTTAAEFRLWATFLDTLFTTTAGWVDTAASGQINLTTVAAPSVANTSSGYKVYRMADTLQATKPIFVKLEFGSGAAAATPAIWITVGATHDGSGNLGSLFFNRTQMLAASSSAGVSKSLGSGDTNRICFAMWINISTSLGLWFSLERTKDATGADTGTGIMLCWGRGNLSHNSNYVPFLTPVPPATVGLHCLLSNENPSSWDGDVGVGAMVPMGTAPKQPGMNIILVRALDFADYSGPVVTIYGSSHVYAQCGPNITTLKAGAGSAIDANIRLCLRYE